MENEFLTQLDCYFLGPWSKIGDGVVANLTFQFVFSLNKSLLNATFNRCRIFDNIKNHGKQPQTSLSNHPHARYSFRSIDAKDRQDGEN